MIPLLLAGLAGAAEVEVVVHEPTLVMTAARFVSGVEPFQELWFSDNAYAHQLQTRFSGLDASQPDYRAFGPRPPDWWWAASLDADFQPVGDSPAPARHRIVAAALAETPEMRRFLAEGEAYHEAVRARVEAAVDPKTASRVADYYGAPPARWVLTIAPALPSWGGSMFDAGSEGAAEYWGFVGSLRKREGVLLGIELEALIGTVPGLADGSLEAALAASCRLIRDKWGEHEGRSCVSSHTYHPFSAVPLFYEMLDQYESDRERWPTLASFVPELRAAEEASGLNAYTPNGWFSLPSVAQFERVKSGEVIRGPADRLDVELPFSVADDAVEIGNWRVEGTNLQVLAALPIESETDPDVLRTSQPGLLVITGQTEEAAKRELRRAIWRRSWIVASDGMTCLSGNFGPDPQPADPRHTFRCPAPTTPLPSLPDPFPTEPSWPGSPPASFAQVVKDTVEQCDIDFEPVVVDCGAPPCIAAAPLEEGYWARPLEACPVWTRAHGRAALTADAIADCGEAVVLVSPTPADVSEREGLNEIHVSDSMQARWSRILDDWQCD